MPEKQPGLLWVVVKVESGIPVSEVCALYENDARLHKPPDWPPEL